VAQRPDEMEAIMLGFGDAVRRGMGVRNTIVRIREQDERMTHIKK
jgi:hypothetical protein